MRPLLRMSGHLKWRKLKGGEELSQTKAAVVFSEGRRAGRGEGVTFEHQLELRDAEHHYTSWTVDARPTGLV